MMNFGMNILEQNINKASEMTLDESQKRYLNKILFSTTVILPIMGDYRGMIWSCDNDNDNGNGNDMANYP